MDWFGWLRWCFRRRRLSPPRPPRIRVTLRLRGNMSTITVNVTLPVARVNPADPPIQPTDIAKTDIFSQFNGAAATQFGEITGDGTTFTSGPVAPGSYVLTATVTDTLGNTSAASAPVSVTVPAPTLSAPEPPTITVMVNP